MSFNIQFFARDVHSARFKLRGAYAPEAVKELIELSLASIPQENQFGGATGLAGVGQERTTGGAKEANHPSPRRPQLCGIWVECHGHIDEGGGMSDLGAFRVRPYYD